MKDYIQKYKKYLIWGSVLSIILAIVLGFFYYWVLQWVERENILLDEYNFRQLEEIKSILAEVPREEYTFRNLNDFNEKLDQEITPKKFCYYLVATKYFEDDEYKWNELGYIFGTKIHSKRYLKKYSKWYYAYPSYDLPEWNVCYGSVQSDVPYCYDKTLSMFEWTISRVCSDW